MNDKDRQLNGVVDCVRKIMAREGPLAFYKGFGMCWARVSHSALLLLPFPYSRSPPVVVGRPYDRQLPRIRTL
jgi:solute carrier family 25 uncoupling protein 8/9